MWALVWLFLPLVSPQVSQEYVADRDLDKSNYAPQQYPQTNYQTRNYPINYQQQQQQQGSYPSYTGFSNRYESDSEDDVNANEINYGDDYFRYKCPTHWEQDEQYCYRFFKSPARPRMEARRICQAANADLVSIESPREHGFLSRTLEKLDPQHRLWYTGARQQSAGYWINEAEGTQLSNLESVFFPHTYGFDAQGKDFLVYKYNPEWRKWGLEMVTGEDSLLYICKALASKLHYLIEDDRTYTYGVNIDDPEKVPRGPYFIKQPEDVIFDLGTILDNEVYLKCFAGGYPTPEYEWFREDFQNDILVATKISPLSDSRFTISGGSLIIQNPNQNTDRTKYHCKAKNKFGTIVSESVLLSFGFIREFTLKRSHESGNQNWGKVLNCDPPPHYPRVKHYWARDFFPNLVEEDRRVFVSYDGALYFSALETIDRGNYSCNVQSIASNTGKSGPFFKLQVNPHSDYQQLKFPNNFPKAFPEAPIVGKEVRLECMAFGYPQPSYNWTRIGQNIPREAILSSFSRVLTIPEVGVEHQGEYVCTITNSYGSMNSSVMLSVQAVPNFTIPLVDKHVDNHADLMWTCEAFGIPDVNYTWWKNGNRLTLDTLPPMDKDRYYIQDNTLTIKHVDPERDPGMYQCEANNQLKSVFSSAQLRVLSLKPSFKKFPLEKEMYGADGGNVTIKCNPEAAPKPKFVWKKDNNIIGSGGRRRILENGNLMISPVSRDDEGIYTCQASNEYGLDESYGRLIVLQGPRLIDRLQTRINTQVYQNIFLHCNAYSDELLDTAFVWHHNGIRIRDIDDDEFFVYDDKRIKIDGGDLSIFNVTVSDSGLYRCTAKSAVGSVSSTTELSVEGPPGPPGGLQVLSIKKNSAELQWTDGASNGRPILGYIVTGKTNWNDTWVNITTNLYGREIDRYSGRKQGMIDNSLLPWSTYEFKIQAYNQLGFGPPSAPSPQHSTPPDKPYRAPNHVGGGGGKIGDLTITWEPLSVSEQNGGGIHYKVFWRRLVHDTEFQFEVLKNGNAAFHIVHISMDFFYTQYEVKVQAINDVGEGPISDPVIIYSAEDMPQVAPQQVSSVSFNSTALNVTWLPIDQTRERIRGKLIGHRLKYWREDKKEEECIYALSRSTKNWALVVGLQPDTYYFVKVMAFNAAGEGPESERFMERTYRKAPQKPPSAVHAFGVNPSTIRVVWRFVAPTTEEEPLIGYKVRVWELDQDMALANDTIIPVGSKLEAYVTDLTPGKKYNMRVLGYSRGGDGRMSSPNIIFQMGDYQAASLYRSSSNSLISHKMITLILFAVVFAGLTDQKFHL